MNLNHKYLRDVTRVPAEEKRTPSLGTCVQNMYDSCTPKGTEHKQRPPINSVITTSVVALRHTPFRNQYHHGSKPHVTTEEVHIALYTKAKDVMPSIRTNVQSG